MTEHDEPRRFSKTVAIKATDDDEMAATGVVLTPNELDRQLDWLDADGVEAMYNPATTDGVMHAAFPDGHAELERSEVLEESETIDGVEFDAGEWVIRRRYLDDQRWELVKRGVLSAFSIGGDVTAVEEFDSVDEIPDEVDTSKVDPDTVPDDYWPPTKIVNGAVDEISDVDIGAVPSADMAVVKSVGAATAKSILDETSGRDEFVSVIQQRGADEDGAEQLYDYLTDETDNQKMSKTTAPSDDNTDLGADDISDVDDATLGKRLRRFFLGKSVDAEPDDGTDATHVPEVPADAAKALSTVVTKEGRPLNATNREALMAAHDAIEAALETDVDFETNRFTDNDSIEFDIAQYDDKPDDKGGHDDEKTAPGDVEKLTDEQGDLVVTAIQRFVDAQGEAPLAEFRDWLWATDALDEDTMFAADEAYWQFTEARREEMEETPVTEGLAEWVTSETDADTEITMSDDTNPDDPDTNKTDDPFADAPPWAKALNEQTEKNAERLDELDDDSTGKAADGDSDDPFADAPPWAEKLHEQTEKNADRIDAVASGTAETQQLAGEAEKSDDEQSETEKFKAGLTGGN